ncbi:MAG: hypothetical protein J1D88_07890 [Treponema sp.]|nr:hypothetical protein [Treponema sp.]
MAERYEVVYVTEKENGKFDVWINERERLLAKDAGYETGTAKAKEVLRHKGGGEIIVEYLDGSSKLIRCYE